MVPQARSLLLRLKAARRTDDDAEPILLSPRPGVRRIDYNRTSRGFLKYRRMARLRDGLSYHSLRHTFASWLAQDGVSLFHIQAMLRQSTPGVVQRYAHLAPESIHASASRAFGSIDKG